MQKLLISMLVMNNHEPYSNTVITVIAILTVFQLVRDIFNNRNTKT